MVTRMRGAGFPNKQGGGREGEEDNKRLRRLLGSPGPTRTHGDGRSGSAVGSGWAARSVKVGFGAFARSHRQLAAIRLRDLRLFRRHFTHKMADTPLPQRRAPSLTFLFRAPSWAAPRAAVQPPPGADTFRRVSVRPEPARGTVGAYLGRLSRGQLRVLRVVSGPPLRSLPACSDIFTGTRTEQLRRRSARPPSCPEVFHCGRHVEEVKEAESREM